MSIFTKFAKLMKNEPLSKSKKPTSAVWIIDESKCISALEVKKLRKAIQKLKLQGLREDRFSLVRGCFMVELGLQAGLRVGEMASIKHGNLHTDNGKSSILVTGKGGKKRAVWISKQFRSIYKTYLSSKKRFGYDNDNGADSFLLNNIRGSQISRRALQKQFKKVLSEANLSDTYHLHCLRHTYTTFLLKASNYNYRFAQKQLGHASIRTTQIYASVLESEGKRALEKLYR